MTAGRRRCTLTLRLPIPDALPFSPALVLSLLLQTDAAAVSPFACATRVIWSSVHAVACGEHGTKSQVRCTLSPYACPSQALCSSAAAAASRLQPAALSSEELLAHQLTRQPARTCDWCLADMWTCQCRCEDAALLMTQDALIMTAASPNRLTDKCWH